MDADSNEAKPGALIAIALTIIGACGLLGASTNAINGAVSPTYYRNILRWHHVDNIWRAAIAQGVFEGLVYGVFFAIILTIVIAKVSKARASFRFARKHLVRVIAYALGAWCAGGTIAMGLAALSPEFYRSAFIGVPNEFGEMMKYAWVGGSIWGILFGGLVAVVVVSFAIAADWRRLNAAIASPVASAGGTHQA